jgi:Asp-tRNA(Asn)/Glu-tRNA(Gln) amidotransferase C subunit
MLARMDIDSATLKRVARLAGFEFTDADLDTIRPALERALDGLARLEALPVASVEPTIQYRML